MKRLRLILLLLAALSTSGVFLLRPSAQASPGATVTVDSIGDTNTRDSVLTLREAMLLATGGLAAADLDSGECAQVSNSTHGPPCSTSDSLGAASADTVVFDSAVFPSGSPATVTLGSTLPVLTTGNDTVSGAGAGVIVDGVTNAFDCFLISGEASNGNTIKGVQINRCLSAVRIEAGADNNTVGGSTPSERNVISGNSTGVLITDSGTTGNVVKGNYIGTNPAGDTQVPNADGVGIQTGAQSNTVGGTTAGERNVISGNSSSGMLISDTGTNGNVVKGNYIGTNATGTAAMGNYVGLRIEYGAQNNAIGGTTAGERNVISGTYGGPGILIRFSGTTGNVVKGNYIGTNAAGSAAIPNANTGVAIATGAQNNIVGGTAAGERNVISGNRNYGVTIEGTVSNAVTGNAVKGNYIGINAAGDSPIPNGQSEGASVGVVVGYNAQSNTIGGSTEGERNVISGNSIGPGVLIQLGGGNLVKGNYIGTSASGDTPMPNAEGVLIYASQSNTIGGSTEGEGNLIAYNTGDGVRVDGLTATGNTITRNSIHSNGGKGIENINGGNSELAPPIIDSLGSASGHTGPKCYPCTVEVFSDRDGQGRTYHGSASTNDDATGTWSFPGPVTGPDITATVTHADGNTSEFSTPVPYSPPVGGIAELPEIGGPAGGEAGVPADGSGRSASNYAALAVGLAAAGTAVAVVGWYARQRWLR